MLPAWAKMVWHSLGTAAVVAAAELGALSALGMIRWNDRFEAGQDDGWSALLTWLVFSFAVAVIGGATVGRRAVRRPTRKDGFGARLVATLSAAAGAAAAVVVAWVPAREVRPPVNVDPELVVAMTAGVGIVVGALMALLALSIPAVAGAVHATIAWVGAAAIVSAITGIASGQPYDPPRLGVVDPPGLIGPAWAQPNLMVGMAALFGLAVAAVARWAGGNRFGIAICGLAGPALVAAAYLVAGPGVGDDPSDQAGPYRASLVAVGAGLAASTLIAVVGRRHRVRRRTLSQERGAAATLDDRMPLFGEIVEPVPTDGVMGQPAMGQPVMGQPAVGQPVVGQPVPGRPQYPRDDGYRDWLDDIGPGPGRRKATSPSGSEQGAGRSWFE